MSHTTHILGQYTTAARRTSNLVRLAMVVNAGREDDCSEATAPSSSFATVQGHHGELPYAVHEETEQPSLMNYAYANTDSWTSEHGRALPAV